MLSYTTVKNYLEKLVTYKALHALLFKTDSSDIYPAGCCYSLQSYHSEFLSKKTKTMEGTAANLYFVLSFILAMSSPTVNAFPMTPYYEIVFFQQSSTINAITDAITVSHLEHIR